LTWINSETADRENKPPGGKAQAARDERRGAGTHSARLALLPRRIKVDICQAHRMTATAAN